MEGWWTVKERKVKTLSEHIPVSWHGMIKYSKARRLTSMGPDHGRLVPLVWPGITNQGSVVEASLLGTYMAIFSLCPHRVSSLFVSLLISSS